jgi:hypothetical protein
VVINSQILVDDIQILVINIQILVDNIQILVDNVQILDNVGDVRSLKPIQMSQIRQFQICVSSATSAD